MKSEATTSPVRERGIQGIVGLMLVAVCAVQISAQTVKRASFTPRTGTSIEFGSLPVDRAQQKTFYYRNTGNDTLIIYSLDLQPESGFTIQFASLKVPPQRNGKVVVQFQPSEPRAYSATVSFRLANGVHAPNLVLAGTGAAAPGADRAQLSASTSSTRRMIGDH